MVTAARFVNSVGVAPATSTMALSGSLGIIAPDTALRTGRASGVIPGTTVLRVTDSGAQIVNQLPGALFGAELGAASGGGGWWKWPLAVALGATVGGVVVHLATRRKRR